MLGTKKRTLKVLVSYQASAKRTLANWLKCLFWFLTILAIFKETFIDLMNFNSEIFWKINNNLINGCVWKKSCQATFRLKNRENAVNEVLAAIFWPLAKFAPNYLCLRELFLVFSRAFFQFSLLFFYCFLHFLWNGLFK